MWCGGAWHEDRRGGAMWWAAAWRQRLLVSREQPVPLRLLSRQLQRVEASVTRQAATQVGGEERGGGGRGGSSEGDRGRTRNWTAQRKGEEGRK